MGEPTPPMEDGFVHEPFADVFLNSCLYGELDALAAMAAVVDPARTAEWEERRERLGERMRQAMWCDEIGGFFPVVRRDLCASQPRVYRHTPALFQPLFAGLATEEQAARTITLLTGGTYGEDEVLDVRIDAGLYHGYQIVTPSLHPSRGEGPAAGGVELSDDGSSAVLRWGDDRSPRDIVFTNPWIEVEASGGSAVSIVLEDGAGRAAAIGAGARATVQPPAGRTFLRGVSRIEVRAEGGVLERVRFGFQRQERSGLLSPFGVKSAHPLDGKHPAPGYPTQFWSGTIWAPQTYHAVHGLAGYGRADLAAAVARAYCDAVAVSFAMSGHAYEHLSHLDGHGLNAVDYTWTAAVALVLMKDLIDPEG
jgi:hypothetical protein